jgi:diguanylate cyclase (GGDEF)-like protein
VQQNFISICRQLAIFLALALTGVMTPTAANATPTDLTPCISPVRGGETIEAVLTNPARFDCTSSQNQMAPGDYWVRMAVPLSAHSPEQGLVFRTVSLWDEGFSITTVHTDGHRKTYRPNFGQKIGPMRLGATVVVPFLRNPSPVVTLIAKVNRSAIIRGIMLTPQVSVAEDAIRFEMGMAVLYAAFVGICIALLVYNIALWRAMRERFLLAYCFMVTAMLAYGIFTSGAPHYFVASLSGADRLRVTIPLLAIAAASALIFIRHFFQSANIPVWLVRTTYIHAAAISAFAIFYALMAPRYADIIDMIYVLGFVPIPILFCAYLYVAWRQNDPFLRYFLIAWSGPAIAVTLRTMHGLDILPYNLVIENSTLIGLAFEALVSSLAIGHRVRLLAQARDRAESAEASAMLMADTDPLTGLLNRRAFMRQLLERQIQWTLILVDIDHFKRVNDSLGHAGGDDAITSIAAVLRKYTPEGAMVARMGGEEFAISYPADLPLTPDPDRLLADIRSINLPEGYRITASIGIASRPVSDDNDWKILYRAADMALYRAKSSGRDCFSRYEPERAAA